MKRYWKLISMAIIIVLVVGTFYIQSSLATNRYPEFVLEKKIGDAEAVQHLTLLGVFNSNEFGGNSVDITTEGSILSVERSFFERIKGVNRDPEINRLQEDYRNFMRGKGEDPVLFAEHESVIAYANMKFEFEDGYQRGDFTFDMQVLEKDTNDKTSITATVPKSERYNFIYVEAVYITGGEMKVVTNNRLNNNDEFEEMEMHLYTFDLDTKKLVGDETIIAGSEQINSTNSNQWLDIRVLSKGEADINSNKNIVFVNNVVAQDSETNQSSTMEQNLIVYNLETNEKEKLELPEELLQGANVDSIKGTTIYFSEIVDDQLKITGYDIESKKIETKQIFDLPKTQGAIEGENNLLLNIKNDHVYIVSSYQEKADHVIVADLNEKKVVYEGTIGMKDKSNDRSDYQLYIHQLIIDEETGYND